MHFIMNILGGIPDSCFAHQTFQYFGISCITHSVLTDCYHVNGRTVKYTPKIVAKTLIYSYQVTV